MEQRTRRDYFGASALDNFIVDFEQLNFVPGTPEHIYFGAHDGVFSACVLISIVGHYDAHDWASVNAELFLKRVGTMLDEVMTAQHLLRPAHAACDGLQAK